MGPFSNILSSTSARYRISEYQKAIMYVGYPNGSIFYRGGRFDYFGTNLTLEPMKGGPHNSVSAHFVLL